MILVCNETPFLRILLDDGSYAQFAGGKLEIDKGDPGYDTVMKVATATPSIAILVNESTCQYCGEVFEGKNAKAQLGTHKKANHFNLWEAEKEIEHATQMTREVKARAGFACDVCAPVQTFGAADDLARHVRDLHAAAPDLDAEGNTKGGDDGLRPGEKPVDKPPAARPSTK